MGNDEELARKDQRLRTHGLYDSDVFSMSEAEKKQFLESRIGRHGSGITLDDVIEVFLLKLNPQVTAEVLTSPGHGSLMEIQSLYEIARSSLDFRYRDLVERARRDFRKPYQEDLDHAVSYLDYVFALESLRFIEANFEDGREKGSLASRVNRIKAFCNSRMKSLSHSMSMIDMDIAPLLHYHRTMKSPEKARRIDLLVSEFQRHHQDADEGLLYQNHDKVLEAIPKLRSAYFRLTSQMLHYCYARVLGGLDLPERSPQEQVEVLANNVIQTFSGQNCYQN